MIETFAELGRRMGVSKQAPRLWAQEASWPLSRRPPWPDDVLPAIARWRARRYEQRSPAEPPLSREAFERIKREYAAEMARHDREYEARRQERLR